MTIRHLDSTTRLYHKITENIEYYWQGDSLRSQPFDSKSWARVEVESNYKKGDKNKRNLPVAFDEEKQIPYTDEDWFSLAVLDEMKRDGREMPGCNMIDQVKIIDPMTR